MAVNVVLIVEEVRHDMFIHKYMFASDSQMLSIVISGQAYLYFNIIIRVTDWYIKFQALKVYNSFIKL